MQKNNKEKNTLQEEKENKEKKVTFDEKSIVHNNKNVARLQPKQQKQQQKSNIKQNPPESIVVVEDLKITQSESKRKDNDAMDELKSRKQEKSIERQKQQYQEELIQQNLNLRSEIEKQELKSENRLQIQRIEQLTQENKQLKFSNDALSKENTEWYDKFQAETKESHRIQFELNHQIQNLNLKISSITMDAEFQNKQFTTLMQQLKIEQERNQQLEQSLQSSSKQIDQFKLTLLESEGNQKRVEMKLIQTNKDYEQATQLLQKAENDGRKLITRNFELEHHNASLQSEIATIRNDRAEIAAQYKPEFHQRELMQLKQEREINQKQMENLKLERDQWKNDCDLLKLKLMEMEEIRKKLKVKDSEIEMLQVDNDKLKWKVRKDPSIILSDLRTMPLIQQETQQVSQITKDNDLNNKIYALESDKKALQNELSKVNAENCRLMLELQQMDMYVKDLRNMFDRERQYLEERIYQLQNKPIQSQSLHSVPIKQTQEESSYKSEAPKVDKSNTKKQVSFQDYSNPYSMPKLNSLIQSQQQQK